MAETDHFQDVAVDNPDEAFVDGDDLEVNLEEQGEGDTFSGDEEEGAIEELESISDSLSSSTAPVEGKNESKTGARHPLQDSWTMWYDHQDKTAKASEWTANLNKILTFDTVEEFWGMYNHIVRASEFADMSNYHLFKSHIQPAWEDPENAKGGRWMINYSSKRRQEIDAHWLYTMLACIGCAFDDETQISGCVVTNRSRGIYRIAVWTKNAGEVAATRRIGYTLAKLLDIDKKDVEYAIHFAPPKSSPDYDKLRLQFVL